MSIDSVIEEKLHMAHLNESQIYEWLAYNNHGVYTVENDEKVRREWLLGMDLNKEYTDEEIEALDKGYATRFAKTASRFRKELIERYGMERGSKIRYAEAFQICPYGGDLTDELKEKLFNF
jgi:hypothetical protein